MARFARDRFERASSSEAKQLCVDLSREIAEMLRAGARSDVIDQLILELRNIGHDLYSFDEHAWCGDWTSGGSTALTLEFGPAHCDVAWKLANGELVDSD